MGCQRPVKTMKLGKDQELEEALFVWFRQKREEGVPLTGNLAIIYKGSSSLQNSLETTFTLRVFVLLVLKLFCIEGPVVQAKARELHKKLCDRRGGGPSDFTASDGWLWRFSKRHGIRQLTLQGEKLSADQPAADSFISTFQEFIEENHYTLNQVFNCDETGLYFKLMPQKSLASSFEKSADGRKTQKERVTINACANASGSIKLPLLLIGKSKNPRCFKNISRDQLPVKYTNQKNAWVNASLFAEWFHDSFVPTVQKKLVEMSVEPRAILLLDNCSAHPDESELVSRDGKVIAKFLPPNVNSLIQPMDQGILVSIKRRYKRKILEELLFQNDEGMSIVQFLKQIDMLKVSTIIAASWDEISARSLRLSWRKILPEGPSVEDASEDESSVRECSVEDASEDDSCVRGCASIFQELGLELCEDEIEEWLETDNNDHGYAHLNDDEIISDIIEKPTQEETEEPEDVDDAIQTITHSSVIQMFDGCMKWLQEQNVSNTHNMTVLRELRELAARKRISALKQKKMTDYCSSIHSSSFQ